MGGHDPALSSCLIPLDILSNTLYNKDRKEGEMKMKKNWTANSKAEVKGRSASIYGPKASAPEEGTKGTLIEVRYRDGAKPSYIFTTDKKRVGPLGYDKALDADLYSYGSYKVQAVEDYVPGLVLAKLQKVGGSVKRSPRFRR